MLAALAASVLALVSPLVGYRYNNDHTYTHRASAPMLVDPRTLEEVDDAPELPREATSVELSPDRDRVAAIDGRDVVFASTRSGRTLGRVELAGGIARDGSPRGGTEPVLSWIARDRVLLLDRIPDGACSGECSATRVRVLDPLERQLVGEPLRFQGDFRTARIGSRQLVLLAGVFSTWTYPRTEPLSDQVPSVVVLDSRGAIEHVTPLPGLTDVADLDRNLIAVMEGDPLRPAIYRFDARRGTVAARRTFPLREPVEETDIANLLLPSPRGAALFGCECSTFRPLDRSTLDSLGPRWGFRRYTYLVMGAGTGVLGVRRHVLHPERGKFLTHFTADGDRRWTRRTHVDAAISVIGRYVYVHQADKPAHIDVLRVRDGRRVARVRTRLYLTEPQAGRTDGQVSRTQVGR